MNTHDCASPSDVWLNSLEHMNRYWANVRNPFNLPGNWKLENPSSPIYYMWFHRNIRNVNLLSGIKRDLVNEAIKNAKKLRTSIRMKTRIKEKKTMKSTTKKYHSVTTKLCSYINKKDGECCVNQAVARRCAGSEGGGGGTFIGSSFARCYIHRFLYSNELLHRSIYKKRNRNDGYVKIAPSKLPSELNPGRGVFANRHFVKNEYITTYAGIKKTLVQVNSLKNTKEYDYIILPTRNGMHKKNAAPYVLGLMEPVVGKGLGSFVNAPYRGSNYAANCSFKYDPIIKRTVIFAIKDVWPGDELYMAYSRGTRGSHIVTKKPDPVNERCWALFALS